MSEERLRMAASPLSSLAFPLGSVMALPTHAFASLVNVGICLIKDVPMLAMRSVNRRVVRAVDVLGKRGCSVKVGRFHTPTMRTGNSPLASWIGIVAEMIDRTSLRNRPNPMFVRPSVSLSNSLNAPPRTELSIPKRADIALPFKASILKAFGFSKESGFGVSADGSLINSVSGPGCQPSTVMSPAPTSSNGGGFFATFYGANVHRTSIPNRLNIGG